MKTRAFVLGAILLAAAPSVRAQSAIDDGLNLLRRASPHRLLGKTRAARAIPMSPAAPEQIDYAELEARYPIPPEALAALSQDDLYSFSQSELDQIYARLAPGPIPNGSYDGGVIIRDEGLLRSIEDIATTNSFFHRLFNYNATNFIELIMWHGKNFYKSEGVLRNRIPKARILAEAFGLLSGGVTLESLRHDFVLFARPELFPAKLYCGQSLLDSRKESVIIDYAETASLPGYDARIDYLAGRDGFEIRDEIRMVRPGLYLGRAYMKGAFVLNFSLHNEAVDRAGATKDAPCWDGKSPHQ